MTTSVSHTWKLTRFGLLLGASLTAACGGDAPGEAEQEEAVSASSYCAARATSTALEWIDEIQVGSVDRTTGNDGGYFDATAWAALPLTREAAAALVLRPGFRAGRYTEFWKVWIDYDHDGAFEDAELVFSGSGTDTKAATITPPSTALLGPTVMRVAMRYGAAPSACGTFSWGEVEDHAVDVRPPAGFDNLVFNETTVPLGGALRYVATIGNRTSSVLHDVWIQGWVEQGTSRRGAGGTLLQGCVGMVLGDLAPGSCAMSSSFLVSNTTGGSGTLVNGPATAVIQLWKSSTVLATWRTPITISPVSLDRVSIGLTVLPLGGTVRYSATMENKTQSVVSGLYLEVWIEQGSARRSGGTAPLVECGDVIGDLDPGPRACNLLPTFKVSNTGAGWGTLVPGPATVVMHLRDSATVYSTWRGDFTLQ